MQSQHLQGIHYSSLLKLHSLKYSIMVHRCVIKSVLMWLHILVDLCWCVYVAQLEADSRTVQHTHTNKDLLIYAATSPPI